VADGGLFQVPTATNERERQTLRQSDMANTKDVLKSLTPPILWQAMRMLKSRTGTQRVFDFEGPYPSWEAAASRAGGWNEESIAGDLDTAIKVRDGLIEFEMDGLAREQIIYSTTVISFLLLALSRQKTTINIIDFGGGLGSNYFQNRKLLRQLSGTSVSWNVVERPICAKSGTEHFQTEELKFFSSLEVAVAKLKPIPDALIFTGSLQYLAEPFLLLDQVVNYGIKLVAFDRLLVSPLSDHAAFVQRLNFSPASFPVWCFSKDAFISWLTGKGFLLVEHFTSNSDVHFDHCGMIFAK
jgi:putative methyltransferase (TIGR04325 family)